jgi:predicted  nucleic acid-binding Zn-ribbon protein
MEQLTYYGKKTVPAGIRKDLWSPMAIVQFPNNSRGLSAYRKLRELRILRDYSWRESQPSLLKLPVKLRRKRLMDQKVTCMVDLATVIDKQNTEIEKRAAEEPEEEKKSRLLKERWKKTEELAMVAEQGGITELEKEMTELQTKLEKQGAGPAAVFTGLKDLRKRRKIMGEAVHAVTTIAGWKKVEKMATEAEQENIAQFEGNLTELQTRLEGQGESTAAVDKALKRMREKRSKLLQAPHAVKAMAEADLNQVNWSDLALEEPMVEMVKNVRHICKTLGATIDTPTSSKSTLDGEHFENQASDSKEIRIYWRDNADFEVVDKWPSNVHHDTIGLLTGQSRYVAPRIKDIITELKVPLETDLLSKSREDGDESEFQVNDHGDIESSSPGVEPADGEGASVAKGDETKMDTPDSREQEIDQSPWWKKLPGLSRLRRRSSN